MHGGNFEPEFTISDSKPIEVKNNHFDSSEPVVPEQSSWQKYKKAVILFLIAGPKASLIMAPIMVKKLLAKYSITITGTMLAIAGIKICMTLGIMLAYRSTKAKVPELADKDGQQEKTPIMMNSA